MHHTYAQNAGNTWYFGNNAGLDFNGGTVTALTNGALSTSEGCSSFSDPATGQILVYTDGITVYDRNHNPMPASITSPLGGNPSSTQSGVIVPMPGNPSKLYIFTTPAQLGARTIPPSLCYSIVDLSLNSGNGDLTNINTPLMDSATEKIAAIASCDGTEFWVVGHRWNCDTFYAFKITAAGVAAPVKSKVGIVHKDVGSLILAESIGYLKFSSDGKKLGSVTYTNLNTMEIFDFDANTGIISNPITENYGFNASFPYSGLYGCTFSPDNSRFYVSYFGSGEDSKIFQYDMLAGTSTAILNSKTEIVSSPNAIGALQNGPNGKMYISVYGASSLDIIHSPNVLGTACNYQSSAQPLATGFATFGLPVIVENFLSSISIPINLAVKDSICKGDTVTAVQLQPIKVKIYPQEFCSISADSLTFRFFPEATTTYTLVVSNKCSANDTTLFTVYIIPPPKPDFYFNPSPPTLADNFITLENTTIGGATYEWYNMAQLAMLGTAEDLVINNPGLGKYCFRLRAFNVLGCWAETNQCTRVEDTVKTSIFLPSVFSPNGDGLNDIFKILGEHIRLAQFVIYNRYGQQVFATDNLSDGWNGRFKGKDCEVDTYYYMVYYFDTKDKPNLLKGDVTLVH